MLHVPIHKFKSDGFDGLESTIFDIFVLLSAFLVDIFQILLIGLVIVKGLKDQSWEVIELEGLMMCLFLRLEKPNSMEKYLWLQKIIQVVFQVIITENATTMLLLLQLIL